MATSVKDFLKQNPLGTANTANRTVKPRGRGGILSSLISEVGGAGGAVGGAAAGAAAGSVVPGLGTLIGGIIGAGVGGFAGGTAGRGVENKVRDNQNFLGAGGSAKAAFGEGALSGVLGSAGTGLSAARGLKAVGGLSGLQGATAGGGTDALTAASKGLLTGGKKAGTTLANGGFEDLAQAAKMTAGRNVLERKGNAAYRSTLGIDDIVMPTKTKPTTLFKADDLAEEARRIGLKGNPAAMMRQVNVQYGRFSKQVEAKLAESKGTVAYQDLYKNATKEIADKLPLRVDGVPIKSELTRSLNQLKSLADGKNLNASAVSSFKNSLDVDSAFRKLSGDLSSPLTAKETVDLALWKHADDWIGGNASKGIKGLAPEAKELTQRQSKLYGLAQGLGRMTRTPGDPKSMVDLGARIFSPSVRNAQNAAGRAALNAGDKVAGLAGAIPSATAPILKGAAVRGVANHTFMPSVPAESQDALQGDPGQQGDLTDIMGQFGGGAEQAPAQPSPYPLEAALADIQRDPKHASTYESLYSMIDKATQSSSGGGNVTKVTAQQYGLAQSGAQALQQLTGLLQSDPGVLNRTATPGRKLPLVGGFISNKAQTGGYDAIGYNIADSILRLRTGATANEGEVRNLQSQIMPRAGDSAQTVQTKLAQINSIFGNVLQLAGGQGNSSSGLGDALSQLQGAY